MGRPRIQLNQTLRNILGTGNVYFQPPNGTLMQYPAIVYKLDDALNQHADNIPYRQTKRYQVTVIDQNPDSIFPDQIAALPMCDFDRFYTADDLNHFVYNLYF